MAFRKVTDEELGSIGVAPPKERAASIPSEQPRPARPEKVTPPDAQGISSWLKSFNEATRAAGHGLSNAATFGAYDKFLSPDPLKEEERKRHPIAHTVGAIAGSIAPTNKISKMLSAVPALGGAGLLSNSVNQALTGALTAGAENVVESGSPNFADMLRSGALTGSLSALGHGLGKIFSPNIRVGEAARGLEGPEMAKAQEILDYGKQFGAPLSLPQAAAVAAPGSNAASSLDQLYHAARSAGGELEHAKFIAGQQNAAKGAIRAAENDVNARVAPLFKRAEMQLVPGLPTANSAAPPVDKELFARTVDKMRNDPAVGTFIGGAPAHSALVADAVQKDLKNVAGTLEDKFPLKAKLMRDVSKNVENQLMTLKDYATASNTNKELWSKAKDFEAALNTTPGATGHSKNSIMEMLIQHPFVMGGLLGGVGGAGGAFAGGGDPVSAGLIGLGAGAGVMGLRNASNKAMMKKLQNSDFLKFLKDTPIDLELINRLSQGVGSASRSF